MVAEVDCRGEGKPLCDANGIDGVPSLKWGDPAGLEDYQGSRSYEALSEFAAAHLNQPVCSANHIDHCEPDKKKQLETYLEMDLKELEMQISEEEEKLQQIDADFEEAVEKLQAEYMKLSEEKDKAIAQVKDAGLKLMKSAVNAKTKIIKDEL